MNNVDYIPASWRGNLAIVARPRGGDWLNDDIRQWKDAGFDIVVFALTASEESHFDLRNEAAAVRALNMEFVSLPIEDRETPPMTSFVTVALEQIENALRDGKSMAVHCRQGLGRAPLIAASLMVLAGMDADVAFHTISKARGVSVPETPAQTEWVRAFAREIAPARR